MPLFGGNQFPVNGRTILITGGSKGFGRSVGRQLAEKGASVIIVARNAGPLKEAVGCMADGAPSPEKQRFHYIAADLTTASECTRVIAEATSFNDGAPPDIVWCIAGSSHPTLFVDTPIEQFQREMDQNYFSSVYTAHAVLQAWLKPDGKRPTPESSRQRPLDRHLVFTSSFLALWGIAGYSPYNPTKSALRSVSDTLSQELKLYEGANPSEPRVRVHTVFPATIYGAAHETEQAIKCDLTKKLEEDDVGQTPDECARASIAGLERGDELVTTAWLTRLVLSTVMGASLRNWPWVGLLDMLLGWVIGPVLVIVRWFMDRQVKKFGRQHGASGYKMEDKSKGESGKKK